MTIKSFYEDFTEPLNSVERLVLNRGFLYGEGAFTTILIKKSKIIFKQEHIERLTNAWLEIYPKASREFIKSRLYNGVSRLNMPSEGYLKIQLFGLEKNRQIKKQSFSLAPEMIFWTGELNNKTSQIRLETRQRKSKRLKNIKEPLYKEESEKGSDGRFFLYLDDNKYVLECDFSNICFEKKGEFYFPENVGYYHGLTIGKFKDWLKEKGIALHEKKVHISEVEEFDGCYTFSSLALGQNVYKVDEREFIGQNKNIEQFNNWVASL